MVLLDVVMYEEFIEIFKLLLERQFVQNLKQASIRRLIMKP